MKAREQFKVDLERYKAQLTPAQIQQEALERRQRMAKRNASRKKRVRERVIDRNRKSFTNNYIAWPFGIYTVHGSKRENIQET